MGRGGDGKQVNADGQPRSGLDGSSEDKICTTKSLLRNHVQPDRVAVIAGGKRCPAHRFGASIVIRAAYCNVNTLTGMSRFVLKFARAGVTG